MPVKFETIALLVVAAFHLIAQVAHNHAHIVAAVENSPSEQLFILLVVTIMPWAAIFVGWKWGMGRGATLFTLSMAASFLFGYFFHFVIDSPDLHSNVVDEHMGIFFHSAVILSLLEFSGFVLGLYVLTRRTR